MVQLMPPGTDAFTKEWLAFGQSVLALIGPLLGFVSGWLLFELTEKRRRRTAQRNTRRALKAELEYAELLLSMVAFKYGDAAETESDVRQIAQELRSHWKTGRLKAQTYGHALPQLPQLEKALNQAEDEALVAFVRSGALPRETIANEIRLPVLDAVLAAPVAGFSDDEVRALSSIRWQTHLLNDNARLITLCFELSFTVGDERHKTVLENHQKNRAAYLKRALVLLDFVRKGVHILESSQVHRS